jgi:hypothetical protein
MPEKRVDRIPQRIPGNVAERGDDLGSARASRAWSSVALDPGRERRYAAKQRPNGRHARVSQRVRLTLESPSDGPGPGDSAATSR